MKFNSGLRDSALTAFRDSIPVMMGYLPLGFVFGFLFAQAGAAAWMAPICSIIVYGGASQYMMVPMVAAGDRFCHARDQFASYLLWRLFAAKGAF